MKIGILSRNIALYSTRRLAQAVRQRGHQVCVINTLKVAVSLNDRGARMNPAARAALPNVTAIIPRIGASVTFYGLAVVRQFEARGVLTTASSQAIAWSRDKLHSLQVMNSAGLPIPKTTVVAHPADILPAIEAAGGLPVIIKLIRGTQGRGVFLVAELHIVESIWKTLHRLKEQMLVQEFIREARGQDVRLIVVGNRCVAAMQRTAVAGEFRSNLHRGGTAAPAAPDTHTSELAIQAARVHGLGVAGVDILQSARGPLVLEVNSSPGLEGIERTTGVDVAGEMVAFLEQEEKKRPARRRKR
ncbi:MAG: RimK family alpha-L-glutamate ligase [Chloroflexi bacterium]|nr:RimK family alpha-L-glutamate ligase [Chloroflexota bacterium]MCI0578872.1 RimK family alpha-L-glutamate ligase [Chloroflexota bacterium]MCI0649113.1 RimK family alpha-L-glutamate ligase [Chloroflexota bacterium]MCI0727028.1 RimK family alpha-L-glutamate ligase [Chloroflexota bacterium]